MIQYKEERLEAEEYIEFLKRTDLGLQYPKEPVTNQEKPHPDTDYPEETFLVGGWWSIIPRLLLSGPNLHES